MRRKKEPVPTSFAQGIKPFYVAICKCGSSQYQVDKMGKCVKCKTELTGIPANKLKKERTF